VLNYLYSTKDLVISYSTRGSTNINIYSKAYNFDLYAYSNISFANTKDCKSTSRYLFKFAGSTVCYCSSKQKLVTMLTTEAKYVSLTYTAKEAT
jgi:hypothetical protein